MDSAMLSLVEGGRRRCELVEVEGMLAGEGCGGGGECVGGPWGGSLGEALLIRFDSG